MPLISESRTSAPEATDLRGLSGWLALLGVGLCLTPLRLLKAIAENAEAFKEETWSAVTVPGSPAYHPLWAPLLIGEVVVNVLLLVVSLIGLWLYFGKRRGFPRVAIALLLAGALFPMLDLFVAHSIATTEIGAADVRETVQAGFAAIIWIPYLIESKRVRDTFIN